MRTVACPTPSRCHVKSHLPGTVAAAACSSGRSAPAPVFAPPPAAAVSGAAGDLVAQGANVDLDDDGIATWCPAQPAFDFGVAQEDLHEKVFQAWRQGDVDGGAPGWAPGQVHPGGGYSQRVIEAAATVRVLHLDDFGRNHREDGPATVVFEAGEDGQDRVVRACWYRHDLRHREDGPAYLITETTARYFYDGQQITPQGSLPGKVHATFEAMVEAGDDPREAMGWLRVAATLDSLRAAMDLRRAGGDVGAAVGAIEAGITDAPTLGEVAAGRLPLSWAIAGR